jgi:hypothetical protein
MSTCKPVGDESRLSDEAFGLLASAFLDEIEARYPPPATGAA